MEEDKKLGYTAPPSYTRAGRGLVYNCKGLHWACVDKLSYLQCHENFKWAKRNKKPPECATKNVYASPADCEIVQSHFVSTSEPTPFCIPAQEASP